MANSGVHVFPQKRKQEGPGRQDKAKQNNYYNRKNVSKA